jgi:hypothetical protein
VFRHKISTRFNGVWKATFPFRQSLIRSKIAGNQKRGRFRAFDFRKDNKKEAKMKKDKFGILMIIVIALLLFALASAARAQEAAKTSDETPLSGGAFTISKTVIAAGGAPLQNQTTNLHGTIGQTVAGRVSTNEQFVLYSGFWTPEALAPTAAAVNVGGRVTTADGRGIRNARITILYPSGESRTTVSGAFGYYRFGDVEVGASYLVSVSSKRFSFSNATQILNLTGERDDVNFIADQ